MTPEQMRARERRLLQEARHDVIDALRSFLRDLGLHDAAGELPSLLEEQLQPIDLGEFS